MNDSQKLDHLLANVATKQDLKGLSTKTDLDDQIEGLLATMATYAERIADQFEAVHKRFDVLDSRVANWAQQVDELRDRVKVLEVAIQKLQGKTPA